MCKSYNLRMTHLYAVLTGDLIGSSRASPLRLEATMANIKATAHFLTQFTGEETRFTPFDAKFTRYRGDGWQIVVPPHSYLRAVALILARLKADDQALPTRIAIGIGPVNSLGGTDLRDASGLAFEYSGRALDALTRDRDIAVRRGPEDPIAYLGRDQDRPRMNGSIAWSDAAILALFGFIAGRWTRLQAEAVALALENGTDKQRSIAEKLGISRQALNLRLTGAGYGPILTAINLTTTYFADTSDEGAQKP